MPKIRSTVARAGTTIKMSTVFAGISWWLVICLGVWLALFLLDNLLSLPSGMRLPLGIGALALCLAAFARRVLRPAVRRQLLERTALALEDRYDVPDNLLINACQFESRPLAGGEAGFAKQTIDASGNIMTGTMSAGLWRIGTLLKWAGAALILITAWVLYSAIFPRYASNALARYAMPLSDIPPASSLVVRISPSSDVAICEGDDLDVRAEVGLAGGDRKDLEDLPIIVWREGTAAVEPIKASGENVPMAPDPARPRAYRHTFRLARRPFSFRVFAGDTYSRCVRVDVRPLPRIKESLFRVTPPPYTGLEMEETPGPPSSISGLPGSTLETVMETDRPVRAAVWKAAGREIAFTRTESKWTARTEITSATSYEIEVTEGNMKRSMTITRGEIGLETDSVPRIDFVTTNRNRFVDPGTEVELALEASDDFGIKDIQVTSRRIETKEPERILRRWTYIGPPGNAGPLKETAAVATDPGAFVPGTTYLIEAICYDFRPGGLPGRSRPVVLRIKSWNELTLADGDVLSNAFALLKKTIAEQKQANSLTENLSIHLSEALQKKRIPAHRAAMSDRQGEARGRASKALAEFRKHPEGEVYAGTLAPLVKGEMPWVLRDIAKVSEKKAETLPSVLGGIEKRQEYILTELISLLGRISEERRKQARKGTEIADEDTAAPVTAEDAGKDLRDDLEKFSRVQRRIIERSRTIMDQGPEDLTEEEEEILGRLAREEAQWAQFFEEKLTDFSKLPLQDFADGSLAEEFNEVYQEIQLAARELYEKNIELAVPHEQSGLEKAEELIHNLERWLPDTPDHLKWLMEEPFAPQGIPLAELPSELEDIVGELLDKEEEMTDDVEDVTSSWMDSLDKGAGWDAMDGPISNMSAKGVTGNLLPNEQEIGGRAGEGRTGRSHGQMVEETAVGKGGRETPTRLTPSPFEQGSVENTSEESTGGATGGGKLSGFTEEGLRGPRPPQLAKMARLADRQAKIRQQAENVALNLRGYHLPTGDLEGSIGSMRHFERSARGGDGLGVRRSFSRVIDALAEARKAIRAETGLHREQTRLPEWVRQEIVTGLRDGMPRGYEQMIAEYFRALAGQEK